MLNFDIHEFKEKILFTKPYLMRDGFNVPAESLREFYEILFNPIYGANPTNLRFPCQVKILHNGKFVQSSTWTHTFNGDPGLYRDNNALLKAIELKSTIVFDDYFRYNEFAKKLIIFLQEQLNCASGCNAYLSQKNGLGFNIHCDSHHVIIFSITGKKRWKVFNKHKPALQAKHRIPMHWTDDYIRKEGIFLDEVLQPGDVLYIPIGYYHCVENLTDNALHMTTSLSFKPLLTLLEDALERIYKCHDFSQHPSPTIDFFAKLHPIHTHSELLDKQTLLSFLDEVFVGIREFIQHDDGFIKEQNNLKRNLILEVLKSPSTELIDELTAPC